MSTYFKRVFLLILFLFVISFAGLKEINAQISVPWISGMGCMGLDPEYDYWYCPRFELFIVNTCGSMAKTYAYGSVGYESDNFCNFSFGSRSYAPRSMGGGLTGGFVGVPASMPPLPEGTIPAFPSPGNAVSWSCFEVVCAASQTAAPTVPVDGVCGNANGSIFPSTSSDYGSYIQCSSGTPSDTSFPSAGNTVTWTCSGIDGGSPSPACSASRSSLVPTVDLRINGSNGPLSLTSGDTRSISWTSTDATSCTASSNDGFAGARAVTTGSTPELRIATATSDHTITCTGPGGNASDSVQVNVSCAPTTGAYGSCDCPTETKTRMNTLATCLFSTETTPCDSSEKNACWDYNWREIAP